MTCLDVIKPFNPMRPSKKDHLKLIKNFMDRTFHKKCNFIVAEIICEANNNNKSMNGQ